MSINEWQAMTRGNVPGPEVWEKVELVAKHHPAVRGRSDQERKAYLSRLYHIGGIGLILDMVPAAEKARAIEEREQALRVKFEELRSEMDAVNKDREEFRSSYVPEGLEAPRAVGQE